MPVQVGGSKVADPRPARVVDLSPVGDRSRASSKKNRRRHKKADAASSVSPMQRLFDTSREVFANSYPGFVPPPDAVARLSGLLSTYLAPLVLVRFVLIETRHVSRA
jgi:plant cysteine oxidase